MARHLSPLRPVPQSRVSSVSTPSCPQSRVSSVSTPSCPSEPGLFTPSCPSEPGFFSIHPVLSLRPGPVAMLRPRPSRPAAATDTMWRGGTRRVRRPVIGDVLSHSPPPLPVTGPYMWRTSETIQTPHPALLPCHCVCVCEADPSPAPSSPPVARLTVKQQIGRTRRTHVPSGTGCWCFVRVARISPPEWPAVSIGISARIRIRMVNIEISS